MACLFSNKSLLGTGWFTYTKPKNRDFVQLRNLLDSFNVVDTSLITKQNQQKVQQSRVKRTDRKCYTKTFDSVPALRKAVILGYNPIRPWMSVVYRWLYDFNSREYFYDGLSYGTQHTLQNF
ncbi:hypothetical protein KY290_002861 [Solanum tuberosum]|uniref:Uncharacterized protein n=1 Tax=Solanum tuberosum TaxID=4113 RepID=A0ABQ7WR98_SOLTU|nr:hypothetical protein KY290_002861 [Solanum tuberosum]